MSQYRHQSYAYQPLEAVVASEVKTSTHYKAFKRTPRAPPDTVPDSEPELSDDDAPPPEPSAEALEEAEEFCIGDVVYLPSSYQAPLAGVLTHLWTDQDDNNEKIFGVCRLLHWPEWMSTMAKKRMAGIINRHEIYYTHKASGGRRQTKTSTRTGQTNDTFEAGPSLHDYSFGVEEVIAKVIIHPNQPACAQAIKSAADHSVASSNGSTQKKSVTGKTHTLYKNKSYPTHIFCERAVDPNRELFWRIDWSKLVAKGVQGAGWDLKDDSSDIATSQGQGVKDLVDQVEHATSSSITVAGPSTSKSCASSTFDEDEVEQAPKRRLGRPPRNSESLSAGLDAPKRKYNRRTNPFHSDSEVGSDDSFQSGDEFQVEDSLLVKPKLLDTPESSDNDGSQFDLTEEGGSDDNFEENLTRTPTKRRLLLKDDMPVTPIKRRLLDLTQNGGIMASPARAQVTPRSKARLMGIKARSLPHPSLPSRPPQLSLMSQDEVKTLTPYQRAKRLLHVGATPDHLPCREDQYEEIMACVEDAVEEGIGGCVYVSGVPGTGKTATVREVIRALTIRAEQNQMNPFSFVEINGIKMADASQAYTLLWSAISGGQRRAPKTALAHLSSHFARVGATFAGGAGGRARNTGGAGVGAGPGRAATVVLMDELDQLVTARQDVMYNMFNWPNTRGSRLVVIAVANTMDLPERTLNAKVASRLGMTRITFMPYTDRQLVEIVKSRLGIAATAEPETAPSANAINDLVTQGCGNVMSVDAITYVSKRVSNVSGDARRMLDVCRRAIELVEARSDLSSAPAKPVSILDMRSVLDAMVKSGKVSHILSLPLHAKILLLSLLSCLRRSGLVEANLGDVQAHHCAVSRMYAIKPPLTDGHTHGVSEWDSVSLNAPLAALCSLGLIICVGQGAGSGRAAGFARLMLACQEDEVRLAFEHDPDERLRKML